MNERVRAFLADLHRYKDLVPTFVDPEHGPSFDDRAMKKALNLKNEHTLAVWRSTKRHPELHFFNVGRSVYCSVSSLISFLQTQSLSKVKGETKNGYE